jgi:hypothetical protein
MLLTLIRECARAAGPYLRVCSLPMLLTLICECAHAAGPDHRLYHVAGASTTTVSTLLTRAGIHKQFGARKKTGSELIFLRIDFKISFFLFLQMLFTKNVSVWQVSSKRSVFLEKSKIKPILFDFFLMIL